MDDIVNSLMGLFSQSNNSDGGSSSDHSKEFVSNDSADKKSDSAGDGVGDLLSGLLSSLGGSSSDTDTGQSNSSNDSSDDGGFDLGMLLQMQGLLSGLTGEDNGTKLLHALKPYLADERQSKVDKAIKILRIVKMIPTLKETGLLDKLL